MIKKINKIGQKDYQRPDNEDRTLGYKKWLRNYDLGAWCDLDLVKFKGGRPVAITELTRCDSYEIPSEKYFQAITNRWYVRDGQAYLIEETAKRLRVPAYLIVYSVNLNWFVVWDLQIWKWLQPMNTSEYLLFLQNL